MKRPIKVKATNRPTAKVNRPNAKVRLGKLEKTIAEMKASVAKLVKKRRTKAAKRKAMKALKPMTTAQLWERNVGNIQSRFGGDHDAFMALVRYYTRQAGKGSK